MKRLLALALLVVGAAHAQTTPPPDLVWSTLGACENGNARNNCGTVASAWRPAADLPLLVAVYRNTAANCGTRWWDQNVSIQWTKPANVNADWCVAYKPTGSTNENLWRKGSALTTKYPPSTSPTPVACVGAWGEWTPTDPEAGWSACAASKQQRTQSQTYTITTPAANGGAACPFANGATQARQQERDCVMPPPPRTSVVISITSQRVYTNEPVIVSWTSQNALSCTASWTQDLVPPSGSQSLTMSVPMAFARVWVRCIGVANEYEAGTGFVVLSRAPDCYAHDDREGDRDKVNVKALSLSNVSLRYQIMAVWWCASPAGPVQQRFVLGVQDQETIASFRRWLDKQFDEDGVRARCEQSCEVLPPGALKDELDTWATQPENSAATLGVIEP